MFGIALEQYQNFVRAVARSARQRWIVFIVFLLLCVSLGGTIAITAGTKEALNFAAALIATIAPIGLAILTFLILLLKNFINRNEYKPGIEYLEWKKFPYSIYLPAFDAIVGVGVITFLFSGAVFREDYFPVLFVLKIIEVVF